MLMLMLKMLRDIFVSGKGAFHQAFPEKALRKCGSGGFWWAWAFSFEQFGKPRPWDQLCWESQCTVQLNLENIGLQKRKTRDIVAEMNLASVTGDLTDRLQKLLKAVESVQASSIESERAFSIAGRFVTKIRNRLGDKTLDSYCFAKQQFLNELRYQPVRRKYSAAE